jgi:pyrroloquinoline quinone biosynthesis protein E
VIDGAARPGLRNGVRFVHDRVRARPALLYPEGVLLVNDTAAAVLGHCDGRRPVDTIVARLATEYAGLRADDVHRLLADLAGRRLISLDGTGRPADELAPHGPGVPVRSPAPLGMLAELTYRCPLHCTYCANPVNLADYADELTTVDWIRTLDQARALGALQVHFSGGEPLLRPDLPELVRQARAVGLYSNLVTSGIPLSAERLERLAEAGLDHVQLSIQDSEVVPADTIAGRPAHHRKLVAAGLVTRLGLPLTINVVLHRSNVDRLGAIADLAAELGAERVELAHTQFYGWAWRNRAALAPTREQVEAANRAAADARARHGDRLEFVYVDADYYSTRPKPCMSGWGSRQFVVAPNGDVLPCLSAGQLPDLTAPNVRDADLAGIWYDSAAFNRFRGTEWMPQPCSSCALKEIDFGGCRCQAFQLIGDPAATDPACELSPDHHLVSAGAGGGSTVDAVPRRPR